MAERWLQEQKPTRRTDHHGATGRSRRDHADADPLADPLADPRAGSCQSGAAATTRTPIRWPIRASRARRPTDGLQNKRHRAIIPP
jgi:hypothetical protein